MLLFFIDDCEYWEAAWLKQQEILPLQFPSPNGSMRWTGAALSRLFRSAVMQLQLRFFRRRNAALSPRFSMMQAVFAATSLWSGIASASGITSTSRTRSQNWSQISETALIHTSPSSPIIGRKSLGRALLPILASMLLF